MNEKIKRYIESALDAAQEEMISALSDMSEDELDSVITSSDELPEDGMSDDFLDYDDTDGMSDDFSDFADDEILSADDLMASLNDGDTDEDDSTKFEAAQDDGTDDITLADDEDVEDEKPKVEAKKSKAKPFKIVPRV